MRPQRSRCPGMGQAWTDIRIELRRVMVDSLLCVRPRYARPRGESIPKYMKISGFIRAHFSQATEMRLPVEKIKVISISDEFFANAM